MPAFVTALLFLGSFALATDLPRDDVFRFHLFAEPTALDPVVNRAASGNYLYHSLYRGLFKYRGDDGLRPAGASACARRGPKKLVCTLDERHRWSSGERVTAAAYLRTFRRVIDPKTSSPHADLLFALRSARDIHDGRSKPESLGITAAGVFILEFDFAEPDWEFEYKLIHPALTPEPPGGFPERSSARRLVASGPYKIEDWKAESRVRLVPNPALPDAKSRPIVEILFIDEDTTALALFEAGKLGFLRRLIASEIPRFRKDPRFHQVAQARFDYIGFGPALADHLDLREALTQSVDYAQFLNLFDTRTPPGCISLSSRYLDQTTCLRFEPGKLEKFKARWAKFAKPIEFHFSQMGGDDIRRAAEWFAGQWKKNLGVSVRLQSQEQASYLAGLRTNPPALFRKGVSLDRPTCLAALEIFEAGQPDNFARLDDRRLNALVRDLRRTASPRERRALCRRGVERLFDTRRVIPLGEMHFTLLVDPRFSGWDLNEINQLDLSRLVVH